VYLWVKKENTTIKTQAGNTIAGPKPGLTPNTMSKSVNTKCVAPNTIPAMYAQGFLSSAAIRMTTRITIEGYTTNGKE
jgi:hypothetical protein